MATQQRAKDLVPLPSGDGAGLVDSRFLRHLTGLLLVCLAGGLVSAFYLGLYRHLREPIGWDTARYLDQTNLVVKYGLSGVARLSLPRPHKVLTSRVGFPVMVLTLSRLFRASTFKLAALVPIASIAATALAAGAFVSYTFRREAATLATVALVVGTSASMTQLIGGTYVDNLLAGAVFAAALVPLVAVVRDGRAYLATILLLGVGGLAHPAFFGFMLAVLGLTALLYVPMSWREWRKGTSGLLSTPSVRLAKALGGAGAFTAIGIYGLVRTTPSPAELTRGEFAEKIRYVLPLYRLPFTVPLAAVGAGSVGLGLRPSNTETKGALGSGRRSPEFQKGFFLLLMAAWTTVAVMGILAFYLGRASPAHRFLAFLLPLPILMALGILGIGQLVGRSGARALGVVVILVGIAAAGWMGYRNLYGTLAHRGLEYIDEGKTHDALSAEAYLHAVGIPDTQPIVFVIDDSGPVPQLFIPEMTHIMRAAFPADRIQNAYYYVGTPDNYSAGRPTVLPNDTRNYNVVSTRFWNDLQSVLSQRPIALVLDSYNPVYGEFASAHPELVVAPGVVTLNGPKPDSPVTVGAIPTAPVGLIHAGLYGVSTLVVLTLIGLGWVIALMPWDLRPFEKLALGSGMGIAVLIIAGTLADRLGVALSGLGGGLTGPCAGVAGWLVAWRRVHVRRPPTEDTSRSR